jgi:hypothetical protein
MPLVDTIQFRLAIGSLRFRCSERVSVEDEDGLSHENGSESGQDAASETDTKERVDAEGFKRWGIGRRSEVAHGDILASES